MAIIEEKKIIALVTVTSRKTNTVSKTRTDGRMTIRSRVKAAGRKETVVEKIRRMEKDIGGVVSK